MGESSCYTPETKTLTFNWARNNENKEEIESSIELPKFPDAESDAESDATNILFLDGTAVNDIQGLETERKLINDTIYNTNATKYDKTSDTAQTNSFKIHNKSINVAIIILFSVLIILVIYLVIKLFGLLK